jgi:hypothetical protein
MPFRCPYCRMVQMAEPSSPPACPNHPTGVLIVMVEMRVVNTEGCYMEFS